MSAPVPAAPAAPAAAPAVGASPAVGAPSDVVAPSDVAAAPAAPESSSFLSKLGLTGGRARGSRKIRLPGEHMNLQPSAPISGQKIRKIKPFVFKTRDQKKYLARLKSSPCRSAAERKCKSRKLRQSCKMAKGAKRSFCRRRSNKNYQK
jgi:hypothetical protein